MRCRTRTRRAFCSVCTDGLKRSRAGCFITKKKNEEHIFSSYTFCGSLALDEREGSTTSMS